MKSKYAPITALIVCASILLSGLAVRVNAATYVPSGVQESETVASATEAPGTYPVKESIGTAEDGSPLLLKSYVVPQSVDAQTLVEDDLFRNGQEYVFQEVRLDEAQGEEKSVTETVTLEADSKDREQVLKMFEDTVFYDQDGYTGQLQLDPSSLEISGEGKKRRTVYEVREYTGMNRNDPALLPKTVEQDGVQFTLTKIEWTLTNGQQDSAAQYDAIATYAGTAAGTMDGFVASAQYSGTVTRPAIGMVQYTLVYSPAPKEAPTASGPERSEAEPLPAISSQPAEESSAPAVPEKTSAEQPKSDWRPVVYTALGLVLLALLGFLSCVAANKIKEAQHHKKTESTPEWETLPMDEQGGMRIPEAMRYMDRRDFDVQPETETGEEI